MTSAQVNGITIEYDVHGDPDAEPLLLVMGLGGQLIAWPAEFVDALAARGFRVIRFDNRDIGLSTKIDAPPPTKRQMMLSVLLPRFARSAYTLADTPRRNTGRSGLAGPRVDAGGGGIVASAGCSVRVECLRFCQSHA